MWNIVGDQNWKDAKVRVLLTAHWDCRPFSFEDESPMPPSGRFNSREHYAPILGADDAASGIAVMLQLAKEIKDKHPGVGIEFMLNDGEDLGPGEDEMYLGVTDYIKHLPSPKPNYGILLDMIGNKGVHVPLDSYSISNPGTKPILDAFFAEANRVGLGSTFPINDERSNVIDDNKALTEGGVPTIDLIDFSYPYWHTLGDTVDKCSPEALEVIGQALKAWFTKSEPYNPKG
jgi:Zn-dependent M28 family amino/carboxypeptidase